MHNNPSVIMCGFSETKEGGLFYIASFFFELNSKCIFVFEMRGNHHNEIDLELLL